MAARIGSGRKGDRIAVNWTVSSKAYNVLVAVAKKGGFTLSEGVSHAILETYQDPLVEARAQMSHHQRELMRWKDLVDHIEDKRKR